MARGETTEKAHHGAVQEVTGVRQTELAAEVCSECRIPWNPQAQQSIFLGPLTSSRNVVRWTGWPVIFNLRLALFRHPLHKRLLQFSADIQNVPTDFVITDFNDRTFIIVTQRSKLGILTSASCDVQEVLDREPTYTIKTLLGKRSDANSFLLCRQLIASLKKPLLVSLSLQAIPSDEADFEVVRELVSAIESRILGASNAASSSQSIVSQQSS